MDVDQSVFSATSNFHVPVVHVIQGFVLEFEMSRPVRFRTSKSIKGSKLNSFQDQQYRAVIG